MPAACCSGIRAKPQVQGPTRKDCAPPEVSLLLGFAGTPCGDRAKEIPRAVRVSWQVQEQVQKAVQMGGHKLAVPGLLFLLRH